MGTKFKNYLTKIMAVTVLAAIAGCTSTEVVDDPCANKGKGQEITLKIGTADPSVGTRAGSDHKLRFSALLFEGDMKPSPNLLQRKETIASAGNAAAQIVFQVPEGIYTIVLVGDYIPSDAVANEDGLYEDKYYNTSYKDQSIRMRSFKDFDENMNISEKCVNNDNYDCFASSIKITKGAEKVEENITLARIVSKVRFVSSTGVKDSPLKKVEISSLNFLYDYLPVTGVANGQSGILYKGNLYDVNCNLTDNELFYFYSLAPVEEGIESTLNEISFSVTYEDGTSRNVVIPAGTIKVVQNYITTVKGAFLSEPEQEVGDIVLNLSKSDEWKNNETEVEPQIE